MKKAIFSVAIALAASIGFAASAQTPEAATSEATPKTEQCSKADGQCRNAHKRHDVKKGDFAGQRGPKGMRGQQERGRLNPFEGLNLTPDQQQALEALTPQRFQGNCGDQAQCDKADKAKCDKADKAQCDKAKAKDCKKDGKKGDKKDGKKNGKFEGGKDQNREAMKAEAKARRAEYLSKVKEILTPEQYTQFLENNFSLRH
ncbi:MAG: hypothetical protein K2G64_02170 [Muribaculaceae bacterium]|nr:hypothetical protein [Muribaculaceae bacterium]